jgi:sulfonate transport system substrate-binding protein
VLKQGVIADQQWYMKQGLVKKAADIDKLVDDSYVEYALKALGEYKKPE